MDFHGITMIGPFIAQVLPTLPMWISSDEGRIVYSQFDRKPYLATNTAYIDISLSTHNHDSTYLGINDTAIDSSKLGGVLASNFARLDTANSFTASQNLQDNQIIRSELKY